MRIIHLLLILFTSALLSGQELPVGLPWFGDISQPLSISAPHGIELARFFRDALQGKISKNDLLKQAGTLGDETPRILFITLSDGQFPSRCYFASGFTLRDAVDNLFDLIQRREEEYAITTHDELSAQIDQAKEEKRQLPAYVREKLSNIKQWKSLQMDIVQSVLPITDFHIPSTCILLSSAIGIAFDQSAGFAFTPEQLTGRFLMTPERQLSTTGVSNLISESTNWRAWQLWNRMCSADAKFSIWLFESDSYYVDDQTASRLYRGNPILQAALPVSRGTLLKQSDSLLEKCLSLVGRKGEINAPFLEWFYSSPDNTESLQAICRFASAIADTTGGSQPSSAGTGTMHLQVAASLAKVLLHNTKHYDANEKRTSIPGNESKAKRRKASQRDYACLIEPEIIDNPSENNCEIPRKITLLKTNAVAMRTFLRLQALFGKDTPTGRSCERQLRPLMNHILRQFSTDCDFTAARVYPEDTPILEYHLENDDFAETASLSALAALEYAEYLPKDAYHENLLNFAKSVHDMLMRKFFKDTMEDEVKPAPPNSLALVCLMGRYCSAADKEKLVFLQQMAMNAFQDTELSPILPDMYGTPSEIPSMTYAAEQFSICLEIISILSRCNQKNEAKALLQEAWPLWAFQSQAIVNASAATALPQPQKYIGYCRDNFADFGFTLEGQLIQASSRRELAKLLGELGLSQYVMSEEQKKSFDAVWAKLDHHPVCLTRELVIASESTNERNSRQLMGNFDKPTVKQIHAKGQYRMEKVKERFSGTVLPEKKNP